MFMTAGLHPLEQRCRSILSNLLLAYEGAL